MKWLNLTVATFTLCVTALPALAQYKVVGPDGKVTYTDRPPVDVSSKVSTFSRNGSPPAPADSDAAFPPELRQAAAKFPVTLYTAPDCTPCDSARQLLQQRGVPYTEKRVVSDDDAAAFERILGGRTIPGATIGPQALRGLSPAEWNAYLDVAGYPRESRLPRGWQAAPATPLVARAPAPEAAPAPAPARAEAPTPPPASPTGIKF